MAYSLRLPDAIDAAARAKADYLGISLNSLLCVALDAYLRGPAPLSAPPPGELCKDDRASSKTKPMESTGGQPAKLTRAEKQALYEQRKREFNQLAGLK